MKSLKFFLLPIAMIFFVSCKKDIATDTPRCICKEINNSGNNWETGSVDEYLFQNRKVYTFSPDGNIIADGSIAIKDENCNQICSVGGFGGPAVNLCTGENFFQAAVLIRNIWTKK